MFRRLRENGPGLLVPLAWTFVTTAHLGLVTTRSLLIAHLVMDTLLVAFAVLSWSDMQTGVLRAWLGVIVAGFGVTVVGTASFLVSGPVATTQTVTAMQTVAVVGWMLLPGVALLYTGRAVPSDEADWVYTVGGVASLLGAVVYVGWLAVAGTTVGLVVGLTLANLGQTAGILDAVWQY